jgi:hypothetical protein
MTERDIRRGSGGMVPELERELLALISEGRPPLEIIKRFHEATGAPIEDCKRWLVENTSTTITPCPYCQAPLASSQAKQCFKCGYDWHDPTNIVRRGDPDWNRFGLKKDASYVVVLCQKVNGERYTMYREVGGGEHDLHCVLETEPALGSQFIEWGFYEYSKHLKLTNGSEFAFEEHGIWMTRDEVENNLRRVRGTLGQNEKPSWVNGIPPRLPPK